MPQIGIPKIASHEILDFEDIDYFVKLSIGWGINKVRITGGEPLVRKDIVTLIEMLSKINGIEELSMTTNGLLLSGYAKELKKAGLRRVNISLDTLRNDRFREITGFSGLENVLEGIKTAQEEALNPVKINVVVIKGINDDEVAEFAELTMNEPVIVRFIEHMPMINNYEYVSNNTIKQVIEERFGKLEPTGRFLESNNGPAEQFRIKSSCGAVGFISAFSTPFCSKCNRLRLTSTGILKPCLASNSEVDIKEALKERKDEDIKNLFELAVRNKPETPCPEFRTCYMSRIGG
jgi:cyclic pyranopterin phosphate synthase